MNVTIPSNLHLSKYIDSDHLGNIYIASYPTPED